MRHTKAVYWCPYMASLKQMIHGNLKICGGTILTHTLTLTAAHCIIDGALGLQLQFGSAYLFFGEHFQATKIIHHKDFDSIILANDIGLVSIFPAKLEFGFNVQPVQLPFEDVKLNLNHLIRIYGWGAVSATQPFSEILLTAELPIINKRTCKNLLKTKIPENTFCLGYLDGRVDACRGDSGGPAMLNGIQIGVISFGEGCAQLFKPGVYTDVRKYLSWLYRAIKTIP